MINPVFRRELQTALRTWKTFIAMTVYVLCLLGAVCLFLLFAYSRYYVTGFSPQNTTYVYAFLAGFQLCLIMLTVPVLTGNAISGERERQTLDLTLVTKMSTFSIIAGKLSASIMVVLLMIIAALPVFGVIMYYGGLTMINLVSIFSYFLLTAAFIGSISIFFSALLKKTVLATIVTYIALLILTLGNFLFLAFFGQIILNFMPKFHFSYLYCFIIASCNPILSFISIIDSQLGSSYIQGLFDSVTNYTNTTNPYPEVSLWSLNIGIHMIAIVILLLFSSFLIRPVRKSLLYK